MSKMEKIVFSYPKLAERISNNPDNTDKAKVILKEIAATFHRPALRKFTTFLDISLKKLYDSINFNSSRVDIPEFLKDHHVVLVPNHQSHADYLAMNYVFFKKFNIPLYVAGGINLNIFPIGSIFKKCGCFFIRRSFASDILYKLVLEGYLYYLLTENVPIEFFFEGGRTRSGKLLAPRYGLFQMLIEAHSFLPAEHKKELSFIPVSINHEYIAEQKSLTGELQGKKKIKESTTQLLKLIKILSYQFGSIHIHLGKPVLLSHFEGEDLKLTTRNIAFACFREVSANMAVNPTSMLALIMLDEPVGAMNWSDIVDKAINIISYCIEYAIPLTPSLANIDKLEDTLEHAIHILIKNKKVDVIGESRLGHVFYSIKDDAKLELLFFKNMILHHFLLPWIINSSWTQLLTGAIQNYTDLKQHLLEQRELLKYEFYLPSTKDFINKAMKIFENNLDRKVETLQDCMSFSNKDLYLLARSLGSFSRVCNYILEGYYVSAVTLKSLSSTMDQDHELSFNDFYSEVDKVHKEEIQNGNLIKHKESNSRPLITSSLDYFYAHNVIHKASGNITNIDKDKCKAVIELFSDSLEKMLCVNIMAIGGISGEK